MKLESWGNRAGEVGENGGLGRGFTHALANPVISAGDRGSK